MTEQHEPQYPDGWAKLCRRTTLTIMRELGHSAWMVYCALLARSDTRTGECFPSYNTVAQDTDLDRRTVIRAVQRLEEAGLITVIHNSRQGSNGHQANTYRMLGSLHHDASVAGDTSVPDDTRVVSAEPPGSDLADTTVVSDATPK